MTEAIDFLSGLQTDSKGRYVSDYLKFTDHDWDFNHDVIQWAFPTRTPSVYNIDAPVLPELVDFTSENQQIIVKLMISYLDTLGIECFYAGKELVFDYGVDRIKLHSWLHLGSHQYKRLTRLLECLNIFELRHYQTALAEFLIYDLAMRYSQDVSTETVVYWLATWQNVRHKLPT